MNNIDFLKNRIIAHRGYFDNSLGIPENSLPAFKKAIDLNFAIELDIHILKDNTIVAFHDNNLKRMTGINKPLKDYNYGELKDIKLLDTNICIPTFAEVLQLVDGKVPLLIEFKNDYNLKGLIDGAMDLLKKYNGKYAIQSFHPACINYFRKKYPSIPRGQLSYDYKKDRITFIGRFVLRNMLFNIITKPDFISYRIGQCKESKIEKWKKKRPVLGWVVNNKQQFEQNKNIFDILIGENLDEFTIVK